MDIAKLILNPARLRIMQYIRLHGSVRTSDIVEYLNDIPRATVYHHVKILEDNKVITVVQENKVRGTLEKVYAMNEDDAQMEGETSIALSTAFHMELMQEMNEYLSGDDPDCKRDQVWFTTGLLHITDEEYRHLVRDIGNLLKPYIETSTEADRPLRKLSIISAPPLEGKTKSNKKSDDAGDNRNDNKNDH